MPKITISAQGKEHRLDVPDKNLMISQFIPEVPAIPLDQIPEVIGNALEEPVETSSLSKLLDGCNRVTVIVDDWDRPGATRHIIAPVIIDFLNEYGIKDKQITVVMGRGLSLVAEIETIQAAFGDGILNRNVRTAVSCYHPSQVVFMGYSSLGTPIFVDRAVAEADLVIGIGTISPTPWGGFSGGSKIILPAVSGAETIRQNHSMMMKIPPGTLNNTGLQDREEVARIAGLDLLVNILVNSDGEITDLAAGETVATHRHLVNIYKHHYEVKVPCKADVIVTTLDRFKGYPQSNLFITSDACLPAADMIADPGATVIIAGCCPQSTGGGFREYMRTVYTMEDLALLLPQCGVFGSSGLMFATHFAFSRERYSIISVVDGVSEATCCDIGINWAGSIQAAVDTALSEHGSKAKLAFIAGMGNIQLPIPSKAT